MSYLRIISIAGMCLALAGLITIPLRAQVNVGATPPSFGLIEEATVPTFNLSPALRQTKAYKKDLSWAKTFGVTPVPVTQDWQTAEVNVGIDNAGQWTSTFDGGRIWRLRIVSEGAAWIRLVYDDFFMPPGALFFLYNEDRSIIRGAFTEQNNKRHRGFGTEEVPGEVTILEYYEPAGAVPGRLHVNQIEHGLDLSSEDILSKAGSTYVPKALSCSINTACSEGNGWESEAQSVVMFNGCTGVLVNNVLGDGKPYVLTANHCGYPSVGQTVDWVFKFNYQSATCANPTETPTYQTLSGAIVRAADFSMDFTLLELLEPIPGSYNAFFAGWSIGTAQPTRGVVIGHPKGDIKKITLDNNPVQNYSTYIWLASFDHGTIEASSSGSPLFNESHQIVGIVSSAYSIDHNACSGPGGDDNQAQIIFPKLSQMWNVGSAGNRMKDYLDPTSSGSTSTSSLANAGSGAPAQVWINEVNANATGSAENDEFVEIVGAPGTNLNNYVVEVYSCSGGSTSLQSSHTIGNLTLQTDYEQFGVMVMGGSGLNASTRDQLFSGAGDHVLPDSYGLIVLKNTSGVEVFSYQYDTLSGSNPVHCPNTRTTRSVADADGNTTMGFTLANPTSADNAYSALNASPGEQNFDGGQILPVELVSFVSQVDGHTVELTWETRSETNNAGFEVHLAHAQTPGVWEELGFVAGYGTTEEAHTYRHRISNLEAGNYRIRLKQVDFDGTFAYSPEIEVTIAVPKAYHLSSAYPNPFNPQTQFSLSIAQAQQVQIVVFDMIGRQVGRIFDGHLEAATTHHFAFEGRNLSSGVYLIQVQGERFVDTQKIMLVK